MNIFSIDSLFVWRAVLLTDGFGLSLERVIYDIIWKYLLVLTMGLVICKPIHSTFLLSTIDFM